MWAKKKKTMGVSRAFRTLGLLSMIVRELAPSSTSTWREENAMSHTFRDTDKFQNKNNSKSCTVCIMQQDDCIQQRSANLPCCRHRCNRWVKTCLLLPLVTRSSQDNVFGAFFCGILLYLFIILGKCLGPAAFEEYSVDTYIFIYCEQLLTLGVKVCTVCWLT